MKKLLIAYPVSSFTASLCDAAKDQFDIKVSKDGLETLSLLHSFKPDALVIGLRLPNMDGLTILRECYPELPPAVLVLLSSVSPYVERSLAEIHISYAIQMPAPPENILSHLTEMLIPGSFRRQQIKEHLKGLGFTSKTDGYHHLIVGISLFEKDPQQKLTMELYPEIAKACGCRGGAIIEHSIRTAINRAWRDGNRALWLEYFPDCSEKPPSNKLFIATIADRL